MRPFVAYIITNAVLGAILAFYHPDAIKPYEHPPGVSVAIVYPAKLTPAQSGEVSALGNAVNGLALTDVKVVSAPIVSLPPDTSPYLPAIEVLSVFVLTAPIFFLYACINWGLKVFE